MGMMLRRNIKARAVKQAALVASKQRKVEKPVIEKQVETPTTVEDEVKWTVEDIEKMPFLKLRSIARQNGVETEDKKASEIKAELIEKLGL